MYCFDCGERVYDPIHDLDGYEYPWDAQLCEVHRPGKRVSEEFIKVYMELKENAKAHKGKLDIIKVY